MCNPGFCCSHSLSLVLSVLCRYYCKTEHTLLIYRISKHYVSNFTEDLCGGIICLANNHFCLPSSPFGRVYLHTPLTWLTQITCRGQLSS